MQFSDTTSKSGLIQDCERIVFNEYGAISDNPTRLLQFTTLLNQALDDSAVDIMKVDRNWTWDDRNYTDAPVSTTDIVANQTSYELDVTFLVISKVEATDENGNFIVLENIKDNESDMAFSERFDAGGTPRYYDLVGEQLHLYPAPDYAYTAGLKVHFQRTFDHFASTDTTKTPGCPSVFHKLISLRACYKYAFANQMSLTTSLDTEIQRTVKNLKGFMRTRNPRGENKVLPKYKPSN